MQHTPVLLKEVLAELNPQLGESVIDTTLGLGGHAKAFLEVIGPKGRLTGIERSQAGLEVARENLKNYKQVLLLNDDFRNLKHLSEVHHLNKIDIILYDLGLASWQLDAGYMGLSFQSEQPLDMRLSAPSQDPNDDPAIWTDDKKLAHILRIYRFKSAAEIVSKASKEQLAILFRELGGVRTASQVADRIIEARTEEQITTTIKLVKAVKTNSPKLLAPVFQALRIAVNDEYTAIAISLPAAWDILSANGRLGVISFQGTEHRLVKQVLRNLNIKKIKRILPSEDEVLDNPRARSAQLRVALK